MRQTRQANIGFKSPTEHDRNKEKKKRSVNREKAASERQENPLSSQKHTKPNKPKTRNG